MSIAEKVQNGSNLLDRVRPGWRDEIDLDTLDIGSLDCCVMGQLYGSYTRGLDALGLTGKATAHGFSLGMGLIREFPAGAWKEKYEVLTDEWKLALST